MASVEHCASLFTVHPTMGSPSIWISKNTSSTQVVQNVGIEVVANPYFYSRILEDLSNLNSKLKNSESLQAADFGAGTLNLSRNLLVDKIEDTVAFRSMPTAVLNQVRSQPIDFKNFELSAEFIAYGESKIPGNLPAHIRITNKELNLGKELLPLEDNSLDLAVSRTLLMHLNLDEIKNHLTEAYRVLKPGHSYHLIVLNPDYQLANLQRYSGRTQIPKAHEAINFVAGGRNLATRTTYTHYFRDKESYLKMFQEAGFEVIQVATPTAMVGWEGTHPHYYNPTIPLFLYFKIAKDSPPLP